MRLVERPGEAAISTFVRGNLIQIGVVFTPPGYAPGDPTPTQPTSAEAVLRFTALAGGLANATIPLALQADGVTWLGTWDSSAASKGPVDWVVKGVGAVQAAQQGVFVVVANYANVI